MAAPVVSDLGEMYRLADTGAIVSVFSRLGKEVIFSLCEAKMRR